MLVQHFSFLEPGTLLFQLLILLGLLDSSALVFAGDVLAEPLNNLSCWKSLARIQAGPRQEHGIATWNRKIYLVGGMKQFANGSQSTENTVEVYDITTDKWSDAAPIPVPVHHANVAAVDGKIYVLGVITGLPPRLGVIVPMTYRYDPATNRWEELGQMPAGTERGASAVAVRGCIVYLAGGLQRRPDVTNSATDLVTSYDTATGTWTTLPRIPEIRDHVGGGVVGDVFYVIGGRAGKIDAVKDTVFAFNLTSNSGRTTVNAKMPTARGEIAAAVVGKKNIHLWWRGKPGS
jgi:N-acetylneuraminic acid mutarotase